MKSLTLLKVLTVAGLLVPGLVWAQKPNKTAGAAGQRAGKRMEAGAIMQRMTKQLNLTSDQQSKIKPIVEDMAKQMKTAHDDPALQGKDQRRKVMEIRKAGFDKIKANLTDEQKKQLDEMGQHKGKAAKPGAVKKPGQGGNGQKPA